MSEINSSTTLNLSSSTDVVTILDTSSGFTAQLDTSLLTANRVITFPDTNGTISVGGAMAIGGTVTGGTTGSVLFIGAGPVLSQDNANFFWDDTNNRLGLGTITPNQQLELTGNFRLPVTTSTTGIVFSGANRYIHNFGTNNFLAGVNAGNLTMSGSNNVGIGSSALTAITSGNNNTAVGEEALASATTSSGNTAIGREAMSADTVGSNNTAVGHQSMFSASSASNDNVAVGASTLSAAAFSGTDNVAIGTNAGLAITSGSNNVAVGSDAMLNTTTGGQNTAVGEVALRDNLVGTENTAIGQAALLICTGSRNTAVGEDAGDALTTGNNNIIIGTDIDVISPTGSNQMTIGNIVFATGVDGGGTTISTGNVGICTNAPTAKLHIDQTTLGTAVTRLTSTASADDPNETVVQNKVLTTNATVTTIHTFAIPASTTVQIKAFITGRRTGGAAGTAEDGAGYETMSTWKNVAGTATQIGATATTQQEDVAGWGVSFAGSGANALLRVSGAINTDISWIVTARTYTIST